MAKHRIFPSLNKLTIQGTEMSKTMEFAAVAAMYDKIDWYLFFCQETNNYFILWNMSR